MIKLENYEVMGWEHAIRGMRNPMNSWEKSDTTICEIDIDEKCGDCKAFRRMNGEYSFCTQPFIIGPNDHELMMKLAKGGSVHAKYRRMITVYVDITAPLYWWKEFDTYKVGTVANSCSTMHKIHDREFTLEDFSTDKLHKRSINHFKDTIELLNDWRNTYLNGGMVDNYDGTARIYESKDKDAWWQMIQLLPSSYNQKRTVMLNYEVLTNTYESRKNHKLDEWREFCKWIEQLPYSEIITSEVKNETETTNDSSCGF